MTDLHAGHRTPITFGELDRALTTLGFARNDTAEYVVFRDREHDALIVLPALSEADIVSQQHLIAVRNTVAGKGIASLPKLNRVLMRSQKPQETSLHNQPTTSTKRSAKTPRPVRATAEIASK